MARCASPRSRWATSGSTVEGFGPITLIPGHFEGISLTFYYSLATLGVFTNRRKPVAMICPGRCISYFYKNCCLKLESSSIHRHSSVQTPTSYQPTKQFFSSKVRPKVFMFPSSSVYGGPSYKPILTKDNPAQQHPHRCNWLGSPPAILPTSLNSM